MSVLKRRVYRSIAVGWLEPVGAPEYSIFWRDVLIELV
jgi:hypothetical protein